MASGDTTEAENLTPHLARFLTELRYENIPQRVLDLGKAHILDSLGCGLAGSASPASRIARDFLEAEGASEGAASVLGGDRRLAPRFAAFANGLAMHADDFDDTGPQPSPDRNGGIHATVPVLAATLALAEQRGRSGRDFMTALHAGVEISCKLNHAVGPSHYSRGYHSTCSIGIFGATAGAARILELDDEAVARALGIAASQSSGLRANFGSMMNPFHAGHAAECAVVSAALAARGFTATRNILEQPAIGFFQACAGGFDPEAVIGRLGRPWAFVDPGMWIKPYPCGALTHPAITALIDVAKTQDIKPSEVASVTVRTNRNLVNTLIHNRPTSELQAKFSMPFAVAAALQRRRVTLAEFTDETVLSPGIQALIAKVDYSAFEKREEGYSNVTTLITVTLEDGRTISLRADYGKGSPRRPMNYDDVAEKFRGCAAYAGWPDEKTEAVIEMVGALDRLPAMDRLTRLLTRDDGWTK
jgi:2-methylcitrate dehydratase PrpD